MLCELKALIGSPVVATDGEMGSVRTFLFDDQSWKVLYLVVDVGNWLKRRDVVLPITALEKPDWTNRTCCAHLTKEQVRNSPDVDTEKPVSTFHIEVAEVPASLIHDKALKDSKVAIRGPHVITQHM